MFNTRATNTLLAFTRLLPSDFPFRQLKGYIEMTKLVFVNINQIENFLVSNGTLRTAVPESNPVTQLSKLILNNSKCCFTNVFRNI